jgi:hypothetical protein
VSRFVTKIETNHDDTSPRNRLSLIVVQTVISAVLVADMENLESSKDDRDGCGSSRVDFVQLISHPLLKPNPEADCKSIKKSPETFERGAWGLFVICCVSTLNLLDLS